MRPACLILIPVAMAIGACAPPANLDPVEPITVADRGICQADLYGFLVGGPIDQAYRLDTGLEVRILGPDDFVTRDFDPNRLTITTTPDETVGRVFCG